MLESTIPAMDEIEVSDQNLPGFQVTSVPEIVLAAIPRSSSQAQFMACNIPDKPHNFNIDRSKSSIRVDNLINREFVDSSSPSTEIPPLNVTADPNSHENGQEENFAPTTNVRTSLNNNRMKINQSLDNVHPDSNVNRMVGVDNSVHINTQGRKSTKQRRSKLPISLERSIETGSELPIIENPFDSNPNPMSNTATQMPSRYQIYPYMIPNGSIDGKGKAYYLICNFFAMEKAKKNGTMHLFQLKDIIDTKDGFDKHNLGKYGKNKYHDSCKHIENEKLFMKLKEGVLQYRNGRIFSLQQENQRQFENNYHKAKLIQFTIIFQLLRGGRPMSCYPKYRDVLVRSDIQVPTSHWSEKAGWIIAQSLGFVELTILREKIKKANFISLSLDEATAIDITQWVSIHVYITENFERVPYFLAGVKMHGSSNAQQLYKVIFNVLTQEAGMSVEDIAKKLICVAADGASIMQGSKGGVIEKIKSSIAPFCVGVHCTSHRLNLGYKTLNDNDIISQVTRLAKVTHKYFSKSNKRVSAFQDFSIGLIEVQKLKRNVETRWISLLEPITRLCKMYPALVGFFESEVTSDPINHKAKEVLELLCSYQTLLAMTGLIPALEEMHSLVLLTQRRNISFAEFNLALRTSIWKIEYMYHYITEQQAEALLETGSSLPFSGPRFREFVKAQFTASTNQDQQLIVSDDMNELCVRVSETSLVKLKKTRRQFVTVDEAGTISNDVKKSLSDSISIIISNIRSRFPVDDLVSAMSVVRPSFWDKATEAVQAMQADETTPINTTMLGNISEDDLVERQSIMNQCAKHVGVFAKRYCLKATTTYEGTEAIQAGSFEIPNGILDKEALISQIETFTVCMAAFSRSPKLNDETNQDFNPVSTVWSKITDIDTLASTTESLSEYLKLFELVTCIPLGSVEDERIFSALSFVKSKQRNRLDGNLTDALRIKVSKHDINSFLFNKAIDHWMSLVERRGVTDHTNPKNQSGEAADSVLKNLKAAFHYDRANVMQHFQLPEGLAGANTKGTINDDTDVNY